MLHHPEQAIKKVSDEAFEEEIRELDKEIKKYSLRPTFFVLFKKSNFLREHHLLSCLSFKNV